MIDQQKTINDTYSNEIQLLRQQQNQHDTFIKQLQSTWPGNNPTSPRTPSSLKHTKKKCRQDATEDIFDHYCTIDPDETITFQQDNSMLLETQENNGNIFTNYGENDNDLSEENIYTHTQTNLQKQFDSQNTKDLGPDDPENGT
jgi:hypothetical protein